MRARLGRRVVAPVALRRRVSPGWIGCTAARRLRSLACPGPTVWASSGRVARPTRTTYHSVPRANARERVGPQIRRGDPLNLSISISGGKETNQDSPSNGERSGNSSSRQSLASIASELWPAEAGAPDATPPKLTWKGTSERVIAPCVAESRRAATVFGESGCLGVQPKVGGKLHLKPNNGTRPIANKYHEGKVKSTLERELKRPRNRWEGNACSRTGPRRVQGAARSRACRRHPRGSSVRPGASHPCTLGGRCRPSAAGAERRARVGKVAQLLRQGRTYSRSCGASGTRRGERWHFHPRSAGRSRPGRSRPFVRRAVSLHAVPGVGGCSGRGVAHALRCGRLASRRLHSTRLETRTKECSSCASSSGEETRRMHNEGEGGTCGPPRREPFARRIVDRSVATPWRDSSESVAVATRKMVNYA